MLEYQDLFIASTDTVVGLGAPMSAKNLKLINKIKGSKSSKPLIVMVASIVMAQKHFQHQGFDEAAKALATRFWPGATTLVCSEQLALRMPDNQLLLKLIEKLGPIYMTSANKSGAEPLKLEEARRVFSEISQVYDFGKGSGQPSRIIDVHSGKTFRP